MKMKPMLGDETEAGIPGASFAARRWGSMRFALGRRDRVCLLGSDSEPQTQAEPEDTDL